jgi:CRISPR-associated protein Csb1
VLLDSVQSQANRMEEALQEAVDEGAVEMPLIVVDFSDAKLIEPVGRISSLQAPHRIADAILRDSEYEKKPFRASAVGVEMDRASAAFAMPLFRLCPQALLLGIWDSTGPKGGLGTKFERAIVSEVVGINAERGTKSSSRIDPLEIRKGAGPVYAKKGTQGREWTIDERDAEIEKKSPVLFGGNKEAGKRGNPSAINHGNVVPSLSELDRGGHPLSGGVTVDYVEQTTTLSLIQLRRLRFPKDEKSKASADANAAARAVLAALGMCAATLAFGPGMDLRSRCVLFPTEPMAWELLDVPGAAPKSFALDKAAAIQLLNDAIAAAKKAGLPWKTEEIVLTPSKQLVELVRKSQELAVSESDEN